MFPVGMRQCNTCSEDVYYCDEHCQKRAWKVHRLKDAHRQDDNDGDLIEEVD